MNRAAKMSREVQPRTYYTVQYIPADYSETLERNEPTDEFANDDYAVDFLVRDTYDRGDEPIEIRRGGRFGQVLWENRSFITPLEPLL